MADFILHTTCKQASETHSYKPPGSTKVHGTLAGRCGNCAICALFWFQPALRALQVRPTVGVGWLPIHVRPFK